VEKILFFRTRGPEARRRVYYIVYVCVEIKIDTVYLENLDPETEGRRLCRGII